MAKGTPNSGINGTLADGLLAHYSFNDGSLEDSSGNGNDAMAVGTPDLGVDKDGQEGQAVRLADKTYIYSGNLLQGSPEISGSLMFKTSKDSVPLIHFTNDLSLSSISDFVIFVINMGLYVDVVIDAGINLTDYTYHHLVFLSNETGLDLYLDKKYIGKVTQGINNYTYICFGAPNYNSGERIIVDEIRLYNRRLTGETSVVNQEPTGEIAEIFTMGANFEPLDITPPTFNTINLLTITSNSFSLNIECNENARVYYRLLKSGNTAPTSAELKTIHEGDIAFTANVLSTISGVELSPNTDYDLYVVAEDTTTAKNLQIEPTKISFSTIADIAKGTPNEGINGTLGNGLIAHYSFNDGSLNDESGNGYHLTKVGTVNTVADKDGQTGQAMEFVGLGNSLETAYTGSPVNPYISAWMKCIPPYRTGYVVRIKSYNYGFSLLVKDDGISCKVVTDNNIGYQIPTAYNIFDGQWHHIFAMYDKNQGKLKLYIDKVLKRTADTTGENVKYDLLDKIQIGREYDASTDYNDLVDEIRIGDRVLTGQVEVVGETATGEIAELYDMGVNYKNNVKYKISEIVFDTDFDKATYLGTFVEVKYLDIKANGVSILDKNPIVKYWTNHNRTVRVFDKEGERFGTSLDLYFQIECDGYETSDVIHKELRMIYIDGYHGDYSSGGGGSYEAHYAYHNNDNYKKSEARILIPLTNTSFISYKK